jgi:hypothetical protein
VFALLSEIMTFDENLSLSVQAIEAEAEYGPDRLGQ